MPVSPQPRPDLDQRYQNLTPRQQAVVDARVEHPDATNRDIAQSFAPEIYNTDKRQQGDEKIDEMNESYTSQFQNKDDIEELIKYRQEIQDNQRTEGSIQTEGNPFKSNPNMPEEQSTWQGIKDRPNKGQPQTQAQEQPTETYQFQAPVRVQQNDNSWTVEFDAQYFQHLLSSKRLPPELHEELVEAVIDAKMS